MKMKTWRWAMAVLALIPLVVSSPGAAPAEVMGIAVSGKYADVIEMSCDTTNGWLATDFGKKDASVAVSAVDVDDAPGKRRVVELRSARMAGSAPSAVAQVTLTDFAAIAFDVWSEKNTLLAAAIQDCDRASFHAASPLSAGVWRRLRFTPEDFSINDDSPVRKDKLDSLKLRTGMVIGDLGGLLGNSGPNTLRIDNLRVESRPMDIVKLPAAINGRTVDIASKSLLQGNVSITNGGSLRIRAPRAIIEGNITVGKGSLVLDHSVVTLKARMPHERSITAQPGATVRFADTTFVSPFMSSLHMSAGSRLEAVRTECTAGGFTAETPTGCAVAMTAVKLFGEFVVGPGARFTVRDSGPVLLWLTPAAGRQTDLRLPKDPVIAKWQSDQKTGFSIDLTNCSGVGWGLISTPGVRARVTGSQLLAVGMVFASGKQTLTGVRNRQPAAALKLDLADRSLEFADCTVGAWNIYAFGSSNVSLKDCTIGEAFSIGTARLSLEDCMIDGTGGYLRAGGSSRMDLTRCRTTCVMVADKRAAMSFHDCDLLGPMTATGNANVTLANTKLTGPTTKLDSAQVLVR